MQALKKAWEIEAHDVRLLKRIDGDSPGAFGAVWRGDWDGMAVAVKVVHSALLEMDATSAEEFEKEAEFMMRARHGNLVRFFGVGSMQGGEPFLVLELVSRGSLRGFVRGDRKGASLTSLKRRLAADVASGMAYIHALGHIHRDLKSGNVLVTENWRAKVADFGSIRHILARSSAKSGVDLMEKGAVCDASLTAGVGTPLYMAPEVLRGEVYDAAADVWYVGDGEVSGGTFLWPSIFVSPCWHSFSSFFSLSASASLSQGLFICMFLLHLCTIHSSSPRRCALAYVFYSLAQSLSSFSLSVNSINS